MTALTSTVVTTGLAAHRRPRPSIRFFGALLAVALTAAACGGDDSEVLRDDADLLDPGDCLPIDMAVSSEKIALLTDLAQEFNASDEADLGGGECAFVRVQKKASGKAMQLLADGWRDEDADGPQPVVWSPAASSWGAILNQRLVERGADPMVENAEPFMLTPLVIAMPAPMAAALGYPETPIGYADIIALAQDPEGWGAYGHPEWGPFRLGKTNPNYSTSALSATIAQYYAATGKTSGLSLEDLDRPAVENFARSVEGAVVHYGDITMTFLNNWFRNDARGTALTYVSAVAVEEKSVIDYNLGNPDGILDPGEEPREPRVPLVAVYPKEGTLYSDNPFMVLDAPWVTDQEAKAAERFGDYVMRPEAQERVAEYGFRPGNPEVAIGGGVTKANGVDPDQPETLLEVPEPAVLSGLLDRWDGVRKRARVLIVLDVSGSMGEEGDIVTGATKLDLAKDAVIDALDQFQSDDEVGLRIFTTDLGTEPSDYADLVSVEAIGGQREGLTGRIADLIPMNGTPLYTVTQASYRDMLAAFVPDRINAIVLLTDGRNEDPRNEDLEALLAELRAQAEGESAKPVRIFPIAYGADADLDTLRRIAEATNAAVYDASDPTTISSVFTAVVSNF
ncbi:MAG: substrate-binding and VWA domain-containing protein [Acidimicrobiia bacterium]|nr:substrate-binding and VWA domain-containing protein [Acidimicrobiia bacterium]